MGTKDQATCADRVLEAKDSRLEDLLDIKDRKGVYRSIYNDDMRETIYQYPLWVDYVEPNTFDDQLIGYLRYQISWGGPAEEIRIYVVKDRKGVYRSTCSEFWFMDWFDGAYVYLDEPETKLVKWAILVWYQEHLKEELMTGRGKDSQSRKALIKLGEILIDTFKK